MAAVPLELFVLAVALPFLTCGVDQLSPPRNLSYTWLDPFTVRVSWLAVKADNVSYKFYHLDDKDCFITKWSSHTTQCLTEERDRCTYVVTTIHDEDVVSCSMEDTVNVRLEVLPREPYVASLEDLKCVIGVDKTNCSWIAGNPSLNLTLSYRICGESKELLGSLTECGERYSGGQRDGCYFRGPIYMEDVCMLLRTSQGIRTFKLQTELEPPTFSVAEDGDRLRVTWKKPAVLGNCDWTYELHYSICGKPQDSLQSSGSKWLLYNKSCRYEFKSRVIGATKYCKRYKSVFGDMVPYGSDKSPDKTFLVLAFVVPLALSICVLLLCRCLRKHCKKLCPKIPDPSVILKDFKMNHGVDPMRRGLYSPPPELIDSCIIAPVAEPPKL